MMSAASIRRESERAAMDAARRHRVPYVFFDEADVSSPKKPVPMIGDYRPPGWELMDAGQLGEELGVPVSLASGDRRYLFVDSTGVGGETELAMTIRAFRRFVVAALGTGRSYGYAVVEAGPFQVVVGVFKRLPGRRRRAPRKAAGDSSGPP